jgi:glycine cleavage system aminomethyltransferase T
MTITLLLHGKHAGPVVRYEPFGPWLVPWRFQSVEEEYGALRKGVGLIDYSTQALIECQGADRTDFLQRLLTNDLARLAPGAGCRAALLTPSAKLIAEFLVLADPGALWLLCDLPCADAAAHTLEQYHFSEAVTVIHHERRG